MDRTCTILSPVALGPGDARPLAPRVTTLRGRVLPIGGLREKLLAAVRAGVERVVLPRANREDLYDVPTEVKSALKIEFVETVDEVLNHALTMHPHGAEPHLNLPGLELTHETVRH